MSSKLKGMFEGMSTNMEEKDIPISPYDIFYRMMLNHPIVNQQIADPDFATEIYQSLTNSDVIVDMSKLPMTDDEREEIFERLLMYDNQLDVGCSFRSAGGFVANLRNEILGTSEDYMDWYCSGPESYLSSRIEEIYDEYNIKWFSYVSDK